ncbi:hypothetical protein EVAR_24639_1 [Eumeta japonica]|uniref:Uncharacterized protein n=1 Tax=Eumeta variegata TaxID=151549 RepID=A0A4C1V2N2_EUMVA|nr:hypothetical protein EVAR_24639_1 [Eumeta japonica]
MTERDKSRYTEGSVNIGGSVVSRAMMSSAITPSLKSVPFFVEEFHVRGNQRHCTVFLSTISRAMISSARTPSQVCAVLCRRVPPCAETSAAALFSCPRSVER